MKLYIYALCLLCVSCILMSLGGKKNNTTPATPINLSLNIDFVNISSTRRCMTPQDAYGLSCIGGMVGNAVLQQFPSKSDYDIFSNRIVSNRFYGTIKIVNSKNLNEVFVEQSLSNLNNSNLDGCAIKFSIPSNVSCRVIINVIEPCFIESPFQPCFRTGYNRSSWGIDITLPPGTTSKNIDLSETNISNLGLC